MRNKFLILIFIFSAVVVMAGTATAADSNQTFNLNIKEGGMDVSTNLDQSFTYTVTGTGTETWNTPWPGEVDPASQGYYQSHSTWYDRDGKAVTYSGATEFRVIPQLAYWKSGSTYYRTTNLGTITKITYSGATEFCVINTIAYWKLGNHYYQTTLTGGIMEAAYYGATEFRVIPQFAYWKSGSTYYRTTNLGTITKITDAGATEFFVTAGIAYWKLGNQYYQTTYTGGIMKAAYYGATEFRVHDGFAYWKYQNGYYYTTNLGNIYKINPPLPDPSPPDKAYFPSDFGVHTEIRTGIDSGSGVVNEFEGDKFISTFNATPQPQHGGTMSDISFSITDDNPNVLTYIEGDRVYAKFATINDLAVSIENKADLNKDDIKVGDKVHFIFKVTNNGPAAAIYTNLNFKLPNIFKFESANVPNDQMDVNNGIYTIELLQSGNSHIIDITATAIKPGTTEIKATIPTTGDTNPTNNNDNTNINIKDVPISLSVVSTNPSNNANGVSLTSPVTITFSENIVSGANYSGIYIQNMFSGSKVSIASKTINGNTLTIKQTNSRKTNTKYKLYIPAGAVKDSAGNALAAAYTFTFTTTGGGTGDTTPPTVTSSVPSANAKGVSLTSPIIITFSENIVSGANYSGIYIKNLISGNTLSLSSKNISGNTLTINHTNPLKTNIHYQVFIPAGAVKDSAGNSLKNAYTYTFTTILDSFIKTANLDTGPESFLVTAQQTNEDTIVVDLKHYNNTTGDYTDNWGTFTIQQTGINQITETYPDSTTRIISSTLDVKQYYFDIWKPNLFV